MNDQKSITALMSAFARAYHAEKAENPIFHDSMAKKLIGEEDYGKMADYILSGADFLAGEKKGAFSSEEETLQYLVNTQFAPTPVARARYCEDCLRTAVMTGTQQYVILGAGFDTFAFREKEFLKRYRVYEVDHPLTQADKLRRIQKAGLEIPENLHFVPCDFSCDSLEDKLTEQGFDKSKITFFSWLGVSMYLDRAEIENFLDTVSRLSAEGSTLLFDYADAGTFLSDIPRVQNMMAMAKAAGEEMKSSFDPLTLEMMLGDHGFLVYEHLSRGSIQSRFFAGRRDGLSAFEHFNYAQAVKKLF
ncbi:MAG: class I SAM-dependent methyltransferase [Oscillospiraceae bacterium]|nr:class I SAM-dependent methyltransferase [Oscillospiraceae bacterium]